MKNLFKAFGIFCVCGISFTLTQSLFLFIARDWSSSLAGLYTMQALSLIVVFGLSAYWGICATEHANAFKQTGFCTPISVRSSLLVIAITVVALPLVSYTEQLNKQLPLPDALMLMEQMATQISDRMVNTHSVGRLLLNILVIGCVPAICEEIFFRGWIQRRLTEKMNHHIAIWVTAIIFSTIHFQFLGFVPRMLLGALLGYTYYYTRSIWGSVLLHFLNNSFAVIIGFLVYNNVLEESTIPFPLAFASMALVFAMVFFLMKGTEKQVN